MLESHCHNLDVKIFKLRVQHADPSEACETNFDQEVIAAFKAQQQLQLDIEKKKAKLDEIEEELPLHMLYGQLNDDDDQSNNMAKRALQLRTEIHDLV